MSRRDLFFVVAAIGIGLFVPVSTVAQTLAGTVEGAESRVLVRLLGADGPLGPAQVTDPSGHFLVAAPGPGSFRIRVERMGFHPTVSETVELTAGSRATVTVELPSRPLDLRSAPVVSSTCTPNVGGSDRLSLAWEAVGTAMAMALWNEDRGELLLDAELHRRQLEADASTVVRAEQPEVRSGVSRLGPAVDAEDLLSRGFIREDEDGSVLYFPPTPAVLSSPRFLRTHCVRLQGPPDAALLGVAFEPRESSGEVRPDVAGVLWIAADSGRPVLLEFAYRNVDPQVVPASAGGRSSFAEMPDGSWVTVETWLRMPLLRVFAEGDDERWQVFGLREERVRLLTARNALETWAITPSTGALQGRVLFSEGGEPLGGADVRLVGTPWQTRTDDEGRFRFEGLLDGAYRVSTAHPRFDDLPLGPNVPVVAITPDETTHVILAPPSPDEAAVQLCPVGDGTQGSVIVTGQVRDSLTDEPLVGLPLQIRFLDPRREGRPYHEARVSTGPGGFYLYCDAPRGQTVRIRPAVPGARSEDDDSFVALGRVERRDLAIGLSTEQRPSGIFGVIRDAETSRPIEAVEISVQETSLRVVTNSNGFYAIPDVKPGIYVLDVAHIGYSDREIVVRVDGGGAYQVDLTLEVDAIPLEGITVSVLPARLFGDMVDLHRRMEMGFGDFIVRQELEQRGGTLATILQGKSGVTVVTGPSRAGEKFIVLRRAIDLVQRPPDPTSADNVSGDIPPADLQFCFPAVWVDGARWSRPRSGGVGHDPIDFTQFVTMDIEAVEIYRGAGSVPGEFGGGDAACGAIVIWTRRGGRTIRGDMGRSGIGRGAP